MRSRWGGAFAPEPPRRRAPRPRARGKPGGGSWSARLDGGRVTGPDHDSDVPASADVLRRGAGHSLLPRIPQRLVGADVGRERSAGAMQHVADQAGEADRPGDGDARTAPGVRAPGYPGG